MELAHATCNAVAGNGMGPESAYVRLPAWPLTVVPPSLPPFLLATTRQAKAQHDRDSRERSAYKSLGPI